MSAHDDFEASRQRPWGRDCGRGLIDRPCLATKPRRQLERPEILKHDEPRRELERLPGIAIGLYIAIEVGAGEYHDQWPLGHALSEIAYRSEAAPRVQCDQNIGGG